MQTSKTDLINFIKAIIVSTFQFMHKMYTPTACLLFAFYVDLRFGNETYCQKFVGKYGIMKCLQNTPLLTSRPGFWFDNLNY